MRDDTYQVTTSYLCAGFIVEGGRVTSCAPILRRKLKYWSTIATRIQGGDMQEYCCPYCDGYGVTEPHTDERWEVMCPECDGTGGIMNTEVVHIRDEHDVYIGRPKQGKLWCWGNPFSIGCDGNREKVIAKFEEWFLNSDDERAAWMRRNIHKLRDKRLGCFCAPNACHGDVLARYAEKGI